MSREELPRRRDRGTFIRRKSDGALMLAGCPPEYDIYTAIRESLDGKLGFYFVPFRVIRTGFFGLRLQFELQDDRAWTEAASGEFEVLAHDLTPRQARRAPWWQEPEPDARKHRLKLKAFDAIYGPGRDLDADQALFVIESPVESPRNTPEFLSRLPVPIEIEGATWEAVGVVMHKPATPIYIGERLMISCRRWDPDP